MTKRRWKILGFSLRMEHDTPTCRAMKFFFEKYQPENSEERRGLQYVL